MRKLLGVIVLSSLMSGSVFAVTITRNASDYLTNCSNPSSNGCNFQVDINGNLIANSITANTSASNTTVQSSTTFTGSVTLFSTTLAAIQQLTPSTTAQLIECNNCTVCPVCVSTAVTAAGSFACVSVSSGATTGLGVCK